MGTAVSRWRRQAMAYAFGTFMAGWRDAVSCEKRRQDELEMLQAAEERREGHTLARQARELRASHEARPTFARALAHSTILP